MVIKSDVFKQKVKYKGTWKFDDFYSFCYGALKGMGYNISENEYVEKIGQNGKEINVEWAAKRNINDYFKNTMKVKMRVTGLKDVEIELEGKKVNTNKGDLTFEVSASLEKDSSGDWSSKEKGILGGFKKFMFKVYEEHIISDASGDYEGKLAGEASGLVSEAKSFFGISPV